MYAVAFALRRLHINHYEEWQQLYVDENWDEGADFYFDCEE